MNCNSRALRISGISSGRSSFDVSCDSTAPARSRAWARAAGLTLDPPDARGAEAGRPELDEAYLILSAIHSAKGQE